MDDAKLSNSVLTFCDQYIAWWRATYHRRPIVCWFIGLLEGRLTPPEEAYARPRYLESITAQILEEAPALSRFDAPTSLMRELAIAKPIDLHRCVVGTLYLKEPDRLLGEHF